jgi:hypothetical protein
VLRGLSSHPFVAEHRELIHKIGVTGGTVEARIAGAEKGTTYLAYDPPMTRRRHSWLVERAPNSVDLR